MNTVGESISQLKFTVENIINALTQAGSVSRQKENSGRIPATAGKETGRPCSSTEEILGLDWEDTDAGST